MTASAHPAPVSGWWDGQPNILAGVEPDQWMTTTDGTLIVRYDAIGANWFASRRSGDMLHRTETAIGTTFATRALAKQAAMATLTATEAILAEGTPTPDGGLRLAGAVDLALDPYITDADEEHTIRDDRDITGDLPSCGCESVECGHPYLGVPAGDRVAIYVGRVCDECAATHMAPYLDAVL